MQDVIARAAHWGRALSLFLSRWLRAWLARSFTATDLPAGWGASRSIQMLVGALFLAFLGIQVLPPGNPWALLGFAWVSVVVLAAGVAAHLLMRLFGRLPGAVQRAVFVLGPWTIVMMAWFIGPRAGLVFGCLLVIAAVIGVAIQRWCPPRLRWPVLVLVPASVVLGGIGYTTSRFAAEQSTLTPAESRARLSHSTLNLPNPAAPGKYKTTLLTYGTGRDQRRPEYGAEVDILSTTVDGSALVSRWRGVSGLLRTLYWGFDSTALPLQGRIWLPDGEGPFPLLLMVHGDHAMEESSDAGYDYLGQLVASHGCLFVSVDQNFLNTSMADMAGFPFGGKPGLHGEHDLRAWLLLEHLALWRQWNMDPSHPLSGRVDLDRVVLAGHSVGGEAVVLAALFNQLARYPDDAKLGFNYGFGIQGVIALASIDGLYRPRGSLATLGDVSFLALHGSKDAQVHSFMGTAVAARSPTGATNNATWFRATVYVGGANHDQFNSDWGRVDVPDFWAWAVDPDDLMSAAEQREVTKVYVGGFVQEVLFGRSTYRPMFADARAAARWLPRTTYVTGYLDARDRLLATFEEDADLTTTTMAGGTMVGEGLLLWREEWLQLKLGALGSHALRLAWQPSDDPPPRFAIQLPEGLRVSEEALVFALAAGEDNQQPVDFAVRLVDSRGEQATLPLSVDQWLLPQTRTRARRALVEHRDVDEPILRRYRLGFRGFVARNQALDPTHLRWIEFIFDQSQPGSLLLDNLGFGA